jgi:hypothetical protein
LTITRSPTCTDSASTSISRAPGAAHGVDLERVAEREQEHQHRGFEDVPNPAGAQRGEDHEQVDVEAEAGERRQARAQREPSAGGGGEGVGGVMPERRRATALEREAGQQQQQAGGGEAGHQAAARELLLLGGRQRGAPGLGAAERAHQLGAVHRHDAAREAHAPGLGRGAELPALLLRHLAEPQRALLARPQRFAALAGRDALGEHRGYLVGERVELVERDVGRLVAHGERAVAEVGLDRDPPGARAQSLGENLEAAVARAHHRKVRGPGCGRGRRSARGRRAHRTDPSTTCAPGPVAVAMVLLDARTPGGPRPPGRSRRRSRYRMRTIARVH